MNKIEKLELKHLCGYLPHGLEVFNENSSSKGVILRNLSLDTPQWVLDGIKPLLLPLSALTEPLPDGTVPIVELAKIAGFEDFEVLQVKEGSTAYIATISDNFTFMVLKSNCDFAICAGNEITFIPNQLPLFEYLYSIHADIYGLIPAGLAIDKTIKL